MVANGKESFLDFQGHISSHMVEGCSISYKDVRKYVFRVESIPGHYPKKLTSYRPFRVHAGGRDKREQLAVIQHMNLGMDDLEEVCAQKLAVTMVIEREFYEIAYRDR